MIYKFACVAVNDQGSSDLGDYIQIAAAALPLPPVMLYKDLTLSSKTAISISWSQVNDTSIPITGYILQVANFGSSKFKTIFNGTNKPSQRQFTHNGLSKGAKFTFRVISINFNGYSVPSDEFTFNSCSVPDQQP